MTAHKQSLPTMSTDSEMIQVCYVTVHYNVLSRLAQAEMVSEFNSSFFNLKTFFSASAATQITSSEAIYQTPRSSLRRHKKKTFVQRFSPPHAVDV